MDKTQRQRYHIDDLKDRFQHLSTETIVARLTNFNKSNDIVVAYKELLKERGINDYFKELK